MWAFSDESERANQMIVGLALVSPADIGAVRAELRGLLLAGQRRIHTTNESARRRRLLLDTIARADGLSAIGLTYRRPVGVDRVQGRHLLLAAAARLVVERGVTAWALDHQHPAQQDRDRASIAQTLRQLHPDPALVYEGYEHRPSHTEPLLWAADAISWAIGAGGDWRRRIEAILTIDEIGS